MLGRLGRHLYLCTSKHTLRTCMHLIYNENMKRLTTYMMLVLAWATAAQAIPAFPWAQLFTQPDGTTVTLQTHGDEWCHWTTTADGYTVVQDERGFMTYARVVDDQLLPTELVAHDRHTAAEEALLATTPKHLLPEPAVQKGRQLARAARESLVPRRATDWSNFRGLVVLVNFTDRKFMFDNANEVYNDMFNQRGYTGFTNPITGEWEAYTGSVRDYFYDNSMGQFDPQFDIIGPVESNSSQYDPKGAGKSARSILTDALEQVLDSVDLSRYDADGDGLVDMVYFIVAGYGSNVGGNDSGFLWPHKWEFSPNVEDDGVAAHVYACSTELFGSQSDTIPDGIGTICHEFSHVLGLPDLYNTRYTGGRHPNTWNLMASGNYMNNARTPVGYSVYERYAAGWLNPTLIDAAKQYSLDAQQTGNTGIRLNTRTDKEFYLIENRQQTNWDEYLPGHGMLVWHIDSTYTDPWVNNWVNGDPDHPGMFLLRASPRDSTFNGTTNPIDSNGDPFPGSDHVTSLYNATTSPSLYSWEGLRSPWIIGDITESAGVITFTTGKDTLQALIEDFETMPLTTMATNGLQGRFCAWNLKSTIIAEPDSGWCAGQQAAAMIKGGTLTTAEVLLYPLAVVSLDIYNPTTSEAQVQLSYSTDGVNWQAARTRAGDLYATCAKQSKNGAAYMVNTTEPVYLQVKLLAGNLTKRIYIDDLTVEYVVVDEPVKGDINGDGIVDVGDVNLVINMMLGKVDATELADVNGDGKVDVTDVNIIINIILGKE